MIHIRKCDDIEKTGKVYQVQIYIDRGDIMDYSVILNQIASLISFCFPIELVFGLSAKMCNFALDMILNRRIDM